MVLDVVVLDKKGKLEMRNDLKPEDFKIYEDGQLQTIRFHYADVARGRDLAQNILLNSGDTIVVP